MKNGRDGDRENANRGYLNKGEEDEMEIYGYESCAAYKVVTYSLILVSLGLLRLVFHWWPQLWLYCTHRPTHLHKAQRLLVIDTYEKRFKSIFVKEVKKVFPTAERATCESNNKNSISDIKMDEKELKTIPVNLADGSKIDLPEMRAVWIKKLCYIWVNEEKKFIKLVGMDQLIKKCDLQNSRGYSEAQQIQKRIAYGLNEINVPIQSVLTLIALEILNPFYVFQVFALSVWISDEYYYYSVAIILMSLFGIGSSVAQTHSNQRKLRETVHSSDIITVKRGERVYEDVATTALVPGDIIVIPAHGCTVPCDAVLLNGNCIVNESMLTGESVPVTKTPLPNNDTNYNTREDANHTLFCGTHVIQTRFYGYEKVHAVVIRTGFLTAKGSLVRSILYPPPADFKFDQDSYKFIWVLGTIGLMGFAYSVYSKVSRGIALADVIVKSFDLFTIIIPPALPGAMTVGKIYALHRLKKQKIACINSRVINVSGSLNCVCFDKTGTLTEDGLDMWGVVPVKDGEFSNPLKTLNDVEQDHLIFGMATCHSLTLIDGKLIGDPLDVKMFESTQWAFNETSLPDEEKYDLLVPAVVTSPKQLEKINVEIGILHQYQFSSRLQRMSVITRQLGSKDMILYCKGSPEMIMSLSNQNTVPEDSLKKLKEYTKEGFRVLAIGWKQLQNIGLHKFDKILRHDIENNLNFAGFIVMENRLKKETIPTIDLLKKAEIKIVMITGDNIQTALSVAKECGIIGPRDTTVELHISDENSKIPELEYHVSQNDDGQLKNSYRYTNGDPKSSIEDGIQMGKMRLATTGKTWAVIRDKLPELLPRLVIQGAVFARMTSDQKQQLVLELQKMGYFVAMCGDGANDCGALKAAHVGISLSEAEASVASPFTSQNANISCVPKVIREGRAALVTSFGVFKFMILYSFTEFFSTLFLYRIDSNITDFQFLFIDVFLVVNFAFFFGQSKAYKGPIVSATPLSSMLNFIPITSLVLQAITILIIQTLSFYFVQQFPWFQPFHFKFRKQYNSYENYSIFTVSQFQYITMAVTFSQGPPYREPIYKNKIFFTSIIIMTAICSYITIFPANWIIQLLQLRFPPSYEFSIVVLGLGLVNFLVCLFFEDFVVNRILFKKMKCGIDTSQQTYVKFKADFENAQWPPVGKRFSVLEKSGSINFADSDSIIVTKL